MRIRCRHSRAFAALAAALLAFGTSACASTPKFQGMGAGELFALGQSEFDEGDYGEAAEALDRLILTFPEFPQVADARLLLARAYFADEQYLIASDEFRRFLERHGGHPRAPEAALGVCQSQAALSPISQRDQLYTLQAVTVCQNVVSDYRGSPQAAEADSVANDMRGKLAKKEYENGDFYFRRGGMDSAIVYWEIVVEEYADTEWAPRALLGIIRAYQEIGYDDLVEEYTLQLLNSYPDSAEAREIRGPAPVG